MRFHWFRLSGKETALAALILLAFFALAQLNTFGAFRARSLPQIVDEVRALVGPEPVALVENTFYDLADLYQRLTFRGRTTPGYWASPSSTPSMAIVAAPSPSPSPSVQPSAVATAQPTRNPQTSVTATPSRTPIPTAQRIAPPAAAARPRDLAPLYPQLAAPGEGVWAAMPNNLNLSAPPLMYKTFLHPDPARPYARVAIVAIDAMRVRLHAVVGTSEPHSTAKVQRSGLIPAADLSSLVAAFNGGFKAVHGRFGMMVDGQTILPPEANLDTIALYRDGGVRIAPWSELAATSPQMQAFRQTPPYLAYQGRLNPGLVNERSFAWGAYVNGNTVIWRSALGISADGRTLFYAAGESLTARRLAEALVAAGASDVAELDVNWSMERFLTYAPTQGHLSEQALWSGMIYQPGMYIARPAPRDFFYLTLASGK